MMDIDIDELKAKYPKLRFFTYEHLPPDLAEVSAPVCRLAWDMAAAFAFAEGQ